MKTTFLSLLVILLISPVFSQVDVVDNKVGLGTLDPQHDVHIKGDDLLFTGRNSSGLDIKMYIDLDGKIGIGTMAPDANFHLKKEGNVLSLFQSKDNGAVQLRLKSHSTNRRLVAMDSLGAAQSQIVLEDDGQFLFLGGTANDERMRIASDGNVGIGTMAPTEKLTIGGAGNLEMAGGYVFLKNAGRTRYYNPDNSNFGEVYNPGSAGDLALADGSGETLRLSSGNVGIGTTTPEAKLDVNGSVKFSDYTGTNHDGTATSILGVDGDGKIVKTDASGLGNDGYIAGSGTHTAGGDINMNANQINNVDRLGIGVPSAAYNLEVRGDNTSVAKFRRNSSSGVDANVIIQGARNGSTTVDIASISLDNFDNNENGGEAYTMAKVAAGMETAAGNKGYLSFKTNEGNSLTEKLRVSSIGNVGIGTSTPNEKLEIKGNLRLTEKVAGRTLDIKPSTSGAFHEFSSTSTGAGYQFKNNTSDLLTIRHDGKVGIGTNNPSATLQVDGGVDAGLNSDGYIMTNTASSTNIIIDDNEIMARNNGAESPLYLQTDGGDFAVHTNQAGGSEFIIKDNGSVGIGTNTPSYKFDLESATNGTISSMVSTGGGDQHGFYVGVNDIAGTPQDNHVSLYSSGSNSGSFSFHTGNTERMRIMSNGNVGIGTTNPQTDLHIKSKSTGSDVVRVQAADGSTLYNITEGTQGDARVDIRNNSGSVTNRIHSAHDSYFNGGKVAIGHTAPATSLDVAGTTKTTNLQVTNGAGAGKVLQSDGSGNASWVEPSTLSGVNDNLGDHVASQNINLNGQWISGDGGTEGIAISNSGKMGINIQPTEDAHLTTIGASKNVGGNAINTYRNVATGYFAGATTTGTAKITMPKSWSNTMMRIVISGYNYSGDGAWELIVGGYNYSGQYWVNTSAELRGSAPFSTVRLGHDGTKCVVLLGDPTTSWNYSKINIKELEATHGNIDDWGTGWTVEQTTDEASIGSIRNLSLSLYQKGSNFGIGTTNPSEKLDVAGTTKTTNLQVTNGAGDGKVLQSDGSGNASWVEPATLSGVNDNLGNHVATTDLDLSGHKIIFPSDNTRIGYEAGNSITSGTNNTFIGSNAGRVNTVGGFNTFIGYRAGYDNTTASHNNFIGREAGENNTTGESNTFLGYRAGRMNTTGIHNTFIGNSAGRENTTGKYNNFIGQSAGVLNTTGNYNNFLGYIAGHQNTTGNYNNFLGGQAGRYNTTGSFNNFFGYLAGVDNTTASHNNFFGYAAGNKNTIGQYNNFFGGYAGQHNTTGVGNNFLGLHSGKYNTTGSYNGYFGQNAGNANTTGSYNYALGVNSLINNTTGIGNIAIGFQALYDLNGHSYNTVVGYNSGRGITSGAYNTIIGANVQGLGASISNHIILADGQGNQRIVADNIGNVGIGTTTPSARLEISEGITNLATKIDDGRIRFTRASDGLNTGAISYDGVNALNIVSGGGGGHIIFKDNHDGLNQEVVRITGGKMGIGTSTPTSKLDIQDATNALRLRAGDNSNGSDDDIQIKLSYNNSPNYSHSIRTRHNGGGDTGNAIDFYIWKPGDAVSGEGSHYAMSIDGGKLKLPQYTGANHEIPAGADMSTYRALYVNANGAVVRGPDFSSTESSAKSVDNTDLTKILNHIESQEQVIQTQGDLIEELSYRLDELENLKTQLENTIEVALENSIEMESPYISQNMPNPTSNEAIIKYFVPEYATSATVRFFSLSGQVMKEVEITEQGQGELKLDLARMMTGSYMYALIVDGELIDTKTMIIVK